MAVLYYPPSENGLQKTLDAQLDQGVTSSVTLNNVTGIQNKPGVILINRVDTGGTEKDSSVREFISYTAVSGNTLTGLTRGLGGTSDQDHAVSSVVEFVLDITWGQSVIDALNRLVNEANLNAEIRDSSDNELLEFGVTASAVNNLKTTNAATGNAPTVEAVGGDANIDLKLVPKGTGEVKYRKSIIVQVVDGATDLTTGDGKAYLTIPEQLNGMNLSAVHARVITAPTGAALSIQIHNVTDSQDMLSTALTIDATETGSDTATTAAVINTTYDDVATNDLLRIDIDQVGSSVAGAGLIVRLEFDLP